jgi:hypothetical protein
MQRLAAIAVLVFALAVLVGAYLTQIYVFPLQEAAFGPRPFFNSC